jgi:hypothetical protein
VTCPEIWRGDGHQDRDGLSNGDVLYPSLTTAAIARAASSASIRRERAASASGRWPATAAYWLLLGISSAASDPGLAGSAGMPWRTLGIDQASKRSKPRDLFRPGPATILDPDEFLRSTRSSAVLRHDREREVVPSSDHRMARDRRTYDFDPVAQNVVGWLTFALAIGVVLL